MGGSPPPGGYGMALPQPPSSFPGQPSLWARRRRGLAGVLKQLPWVSNLEPSRSQGVVLKDIRLADNLGDPGSSRARGPWPSSALLQGPGPRGLQNFESRVPFRGPGPGPEVTLFILVPFPPGCSHQAGITRRAWAENDFIGSLQLGKLRPALSPTLPSSLQTLWAPQPAALADETMTLVLAGGQVNLPRACHGGGGEELSPRLWGIWEHSGPQRLGCSWEGDTHSTPSF